MFTEFEIFGLQLSSFESLIFMGVIIGLWVFYIDSKRYEFDRREIIPIAFWGLVSSFIGGRIFFQLFFAENPFTPLTFHKFINSGSMYYGNEIFAFAAVAIYVTITKLPMLKVMDSLSILFLILHVFGRLGCFSAGCCYGVETDSFFGVLFPHLTSYVHPTQLYESFALLVGFIVIWFLRKKIAIPGVIFSIYFIYYSIVRFSIEFIRDDAYPIEPIGLSPSQNIAVILLVFAILGLFRILTNYKKVVN